MPGTVRGWILPPWEGGPHRLPSCHTLIACHGEAASPIVGRAVDAPIPELSFSCLLILLQVWLTCKASSPPKKKRDELKRWVLAQVGGDNAKIVGLPLGGCEAAYQPCQWPTRTGVGLTSDTQY